jgi:diguanylate cyclase (GGDEF)-like protein/PAS domain S-box-containing protein
MPRNIRGRNPLDMVSPLCRALLDNAKEGQYVLDRDTHRFLEVNRAFEELTGYSRAELLNGKIHAEDLAHPKDQKLHEDRLSTTSDDHAQWETHYFRLLRKDGELRNIEATVSPARYGRHEAVVGSVRDLTYWREMERRLRSEISLQRRRTIEAARANVRLFELTEQVSTTYELTTSLVKSKNIDELFRESAKVLTDKNGLNCMDVTFYLLKNEILEVAYTTKRIANRLNLSKSPRLRRLVEGQLPEPLAGKHYAMVPFRSRDRAFGVLRVEFHKSAGKLDTSSEEPLARGRWDIFSTLVNVISVMIDNLRLYEKVVQQTIIDPLTQVYNRRYFDRQAHAEVVRAKRFQKKISFILIDIDNLKEINDEFGHQAGDNVLRQTATILKKHCREMDIISRYGGDEFVVILLETGPSEGLHKAEELRSLIAAHKFTATNGKQKEIPLTTSIGVASLGEGIKNEAQLFEAADRALYLAKGQGKNCARCYAPLTRERRPNIHA